MKIRIDERTWQRLFSQLWKTDAVETAAILMGICTENENETIIAIQEVVVVPDDAYLVRKPDQISIDPIAFNRMIKPAMKNNWSVITIHTHPHTIDPWFSRADDDGDSQLMPSIHCRIPGVLHGSMVAVSSGNVAARLFNDGGQITHAKVCVVGNTLWQSSVSKYVAEEWFHRQQLALGQLGQSKLKELTVGVIGLGGTGSLVSMQLAHLGVGKIVLIDGDLVEATNLSRIVGASITDVGTEYKVDVANRYINRLGLQTNTLVYREHFRAQMEKKFAHCDIVFSCVDTQSPRALLNRYSYKYHVPVIDLGTIFRVDQTGHIISDAGRVVTIGPGKPCLSCWGHIDSDAIRIESMSEREVQAQIDEGYIQGFNVAQPSVIGFNTYVAGAAVTEMLRMATSFSGAESPPKRLAFSFRAGEVRRNKLAANSECTICGKKG